MTVVKSKKNGFPCASILFENKNNKKKKKKTWKKIAFPSDFFSCTGYRVDGMMAQDLIVLGGGGGLFMNITDGILRLLKTVLKRTSLFRFVDH